MANEKRLRLLGMCSATGGSVLLAQSLTGRPVGYSDTIVLNTPYLQFAGGTILGSGQGAAGGGQQLIGLSAVPPGSPQWTPPALSPGGSNPVPIPADSYLPITVDPATGYAEEIWLTGFVSATSTTSTWTGVRGCGSSTGAPAHNAAQVYPVGLVISGPTPYDKLLSIDDPWGGNLGLDYEFQGDSTALPTYSWQGQQYQWQWLPAPNSTKGPATYTEAWGRGSIYTPGPSGTVGIGLSLATFPPLWTATIKVTSLLSAVAQSWATFGFYDSTTGKLLGIGVQSNTSNFYTQTFASVNAQASGQFGLTDAGYGMYSMMNCYLRIQQIGTNTYNFLCSTDGLNWLPMALSYNPVTSDTMTPSSIFFGCGSSNVLLGVSAQFFRVRSP